MLERPNVRDEKILAVVLDCFAVQGNRVEFLPIGNDPNTAVFRLVAEDGTPYFLKLRSGRFDEMSVAVPKFLSEQGIRQVIVPLSTKSGQLWATMDEFTMMLYPFVQGHDAFVVELSPRQWVEFGMALRRIHSAQVPEAMRNRLPHEQFSDEWRVRVRQFQARAETERVVEPVSAGLMKLLREQRKTITFLVERAEQLAALLQQQSQEFVLCHTDVHAWNLLIDRDENLYIVDWDNPTLAPKERDLMFIGGGIGFVPDAELEALFYQGYGETAVDPVALAYYRYERIVEDIVAYCDQILLSYEANRDRADGLALLASQFAPNDVVEIAMRSEERLPPEVQRTPLSLHHP